MKVGRVEYGSFVSSSGYDSETGRVVMQPRRMITVGGYPPIPKPLPPPPAPPAPPADQLAKLWRAVLSMKGAQE
jgi:hypothetical protein